MRVVYLISRGACIVGPALFWVAFALLAPMREHPYLWAAFAAGMVHWAFDLTLRWNAPRLRVWLHRAMASSEGGAVVCAHQLAALLRHHRHYWVRLHGGWDGEYLAEEVEVVHAPGTSAGQPLVVVRTGDDDVICLWPPFVLLDVTPDALRFQVDEVLTLTPDHGADSCLSCCHGDDKVPLPRRGSPP